MSLHSLNFGSLRLWALLAVIVLPLSVSVAPLSVSAQPRVTKEDAYAQVEVSSGRITWFTTNGDSRLSFANKSFVSFKVGAKIYSNHDAPAAGVTAFPQGTLKRSGPVGNDTIVYTWSIDGLDFIQKVWGVTVSTGNPPPGKAQIVAAWSVKNNSGSLVNVGSQFLLDVAVNNDAAKTLTKNGYRLTWAQYGGSSGRPVPPFFINFENDLPNAPTFNPGLSGQGWFDNPLLGLTKPYRVTIGDWRKLEQVAWGPTSPLPVEQIEDNAILFEWTDFSVAPDGVERKGPSMSYGTGDYQTCGGKLFALLFYPKELKYDAVGDKYLPNPFTFEAYIFNPEKAITAANVSVKLEVGPNLTIRNGDTPTMDEKAPEPDFINAEDVTYASWDVQADLYRNCTGPLDSWLRLSAVSSLGPPGLIDCEYPIRLPCTEQDILPPLYGPEVIVNDSVKTLDVVDNRDEDKGIQRIDYTVTKGPANNVIVAIPTLTPCQMTPVTLRAEQVDSTIESCVRFRTTDCAGNWSEQEVCFIARPVIPIPDTKQPRFTLIEEVGRYDETVCNVLRDSLLVRDDSANDKGLASVTLTPGYPVANMRLVSAPISQGALQHRFSVEVIDRFQNGQISVRATDVSGNFADTVYSYCTLPDTLDPVVTISPLNNFLWNVTVDELRHWDRLIDIINVTGRVNVTVVPDPAVTLPKNQNTYSFVVSIVDTTKDASWCVMARDNASNETTTICQSLEPPKDIYPPVIILTPLPSTNPNRVTVNINDIHYQGSDRIWYDLGIDSVWFTNVRGMDDGNGLQPRSFKPAVDEVLPHFDIWVVDTNDAVNPQACVTINARDSAGNRNSYNWCYPIQGDIFAPLIIGTGATQQYLNLKVTDERPMDRGLKTIELVTSDNFRPFAPIVLSSDKDADIQIDIDNNARSAVGRVQSLDMWGFNSPNIDVKTNHTSSVDVAIWVQPFDIKNSHLIEKSGEFTLPMSLLKNDDYSVNDKGIRKYEFVFDIQGDPEVTFVRVDAAGTLSEGWDVQAIPLTGRQVRIIAEAPASTYMTSLSAADTVVLNLVFSGMESEYSKSAQIVIVPENNQTLRFNDGDTYLVTGSPSTNTAILPAPRGWLSNSTIVVAGTCTPISQIGPSVLGSIMLEAVNPNPISTKGQVRFGLGKDAAVSLRLYNSIGETVMTLVDDQLPSGLYEQQFNAQALSSGTYYLRLESQGQIRTKTIKISK